jgi:hypothetical protein
MEFSAPSNPNSSAKRSCVGIEAQSFDQFFARYIAYSQEGQTRWENSIASANEQSSVNILTEGAKSSAVKA